jgi:hypothetical protein
MDKIFTISTTPVLVAVDRVPTSYRVDFTGPAEVPSLSIPYDSLEARTQTFAVAGSYVAVAGLLDQDGNLLGSTSSVAFEVGPEVPATKEVNAVGGITVS